MFIPLGDLHDTHHGGPYRAFNISRELEAHGYTAMGSTPSLPHSWEQVIEVAVALRERVPPPRPFLPMQPDPNDPSVVDGASPLIIE